MDSLKAACADGKYRAVYENMVIESHVRLRLLPQTLDWTCCFKNTDSDRNIIS